MINEDILNHIKSELERKWCVSSAMNKERQDFFWKGVKAGLDEYLIQLNQPVKIPKYGVEVSEGSFMWRKLTAMCPDGNKFFSQHYSGDYYNTAYTEYYNQDGQLIYTENHKTYG